MKKVPPFLQIASVEAMDILTGMSIVIVHGLDTEGRVWQKTGAKPWELLSQETDEIDTV